MSETVKQTSVALGDEEKKLVNMFANANGLNFSAALRMILRRWAVLEDERIRITEQGKQALEEAKK
jgi:hypothetical protein